MGTEEFWIPAAISALGVGTTYAVQQDAANKQDRAQAQAIQNQQDIQNKASGAARRTLEKVQSSNPQALQNSSTAQYVDQLRRNAAGAAVGGPDSSLSTVGGSGRYKEGVAQAQKDVNAKGNVLAGQLGAIDAATRQRQNEGLSFGDLATQLTGYGAQSQTQSFVDQLRANVAGQANPWGQLAGQLITNFGQNYRGGGKTGKNSGGLNGGISVNDTGSVPMPGQGYTANA